MLGGNKGLGFLVIIILIGALLGAVLGEIIGVIFPNKDSFVNKIFTTGISPGFKVDSVNLYVIKINFGMRVKLNLCSVIGACLAVYFFKFL